MSPGASGGPGPTGTGAPHGEREGRVHWAPSAVTLAGLALALAAAGLALRGVYAVPFVLLIAAGLADLFDGWVARRTGGGGSPFGVQLDSLADMVSFGVVPVVLMLAVRDGDPGLPGTVMELGVAWAYAACAALRLAWFNASASDGTGVITHYTGLPVTYAALLFPLAFAVGESLSGVDAGTLLLATAAATGALFVVPVPVPKPRGWAYPFFVALAIGVSGYLLCYLPPGGAP